MGGKLRYPPHMTPVVGQLDSAQVIVGTVNAQTRKGWRPPPIHVVRANLGDFETSR